MTTSALRQKGTELTTHKGSTPVEDSDLEILARYQADHEKRITRLEERIVVLTDTITDLRQAIGVVGTLLRRHQPINQAVAQELRRMGVG